MGNITNVYVKFNYDWLRIDKALGNFRKSDNKNNVRSACGPFPDPKKHIQQNRFTSRFSGLPEISGAVAILGSRPSRHICFKALNMRHTSRLFD